MASAFSLVARKIFGSKNEREIKRLRPDVDEINRLEPEISALSDDQLRAKIAEWKANISAIEDREEREEAMWDLIPEVFATVREASKRTLGQRHFDVQLIGGMVLHQGKIAEMKTGEGKTLVATLPAVLNSLAGRGVHVVTVNDYLARRDAEWMGRIYNFLGLDVGVVVHGLNDQQRKISYGCDITYGQNNEFGFDYLRDNMKFNLEEYVQREHYFAVVDEVDSILIDEARTPLIISGASEESTDTYYVVDRVIPRLKLEEHYTVDEKLRTVALTEAGVTRVEELLGVDNLYDPRNILMLHHANQGLKAHALFKRDVDYVVKDGQVVIVDEFTGRLMPGRRWSDGLHQAIEAKENVKIESENQTLATITFQNYFRMYKKLAGMTGTADTEAVEFKEIYNLDVVVIPTNMPMIREDNHDVVFKSEAEKFDAVIEEIRDCYERGQPVLVGTVSIEKSERVAEQLKKTGIKHFVLNAKNHEREAEIVAQAGRFKAVTISTNMAGRGTDIVLGGNHEGLAAAEAGTRDPNDANFQAALAKYREHCANERQQVLAAGGLHILGTERHESRRIDNQLRGRSGRQGDQGSSRFYLSLEDNLMRIFGDPTRMKALMTRVGMKAGEAIESGMLTRQIERAQRRVEQHNFDARKQLLEYDDVANDQRRVIYQQRTDLMSAEDVAEAVKGIREDVVAQLVDQYVPGGAPEEQWDAPGLIQAIERDFGPSLAIDEWLKAEEAGDGSGLRNKIVAALEESYAQKEASVGIQVMRYIEKEVMLRTLDQHWREHLAAMDYMRQGIYLRSYAQKNPKQEYKREAFELFSGMLDRIKFDTVTTVSKIQVRSEEELEREALERQQRLARALRAQHAEAVSAIQAVPGPGPGPGDGGGSDSAPPSGNVMEIEPRSAPENAAPFVRPMPKVGRNEPCPCGSGRKYKHCHGTLQQASG